jgi:hypothetical protein
MARKIWRDEQWMTFVVFDEKNSPSAFFSFNFKFSLWAREDLNLHGLSATSS